MSDRHEKWVRVEPGTVIPAGQPYRIEWYGVYAHTVPDAILASERVCHDREMPVLGGEDWFIDSSWKPPLVLPTEPTWGIAVRPYDNVFGQWHVDEDNWFKGVHQGVHYGNPVEQILDFIELTDDQIARLEAAR